MEASLAQFSLSSGNFEFWVIGFLLVILFSGDAEVLKNSRGGSV